MWPPDSFGLVDRCALFHDIRNQDRRELSGLASHCVPPAVGRLAQMPVPVCLFRRKDRSCAHSFRTKHQAGTSPSGRTGRVPRAIGERPVFAHLRRLSDRSN